jgi:hypothetical protein
MPKEFQNGPLEQDILNANAYFKNKIATSKLWYY